MNLLTLDRTEVIILIVFYVATIYACYSAGWMRGRRKLRMEQYLRDQYPSIEIFRVPGKEKTNVR